MLSLAVTPSRFLCTTNREAHALPQVPFLPSGEKKVLQHFMEKEDWDKRTSPVEFLLLLGLSNVPKLQAPLFLLSLGIYIVTVFVNILIVVLVLADGHLHTPMSVFLGNFSSVEICYTSTILPRLLASFLARDRTISAQGCMAQFFFFGCFAVFPFGLTLVSYICIKAAVLRIPTTMGRQKAFSTCSSHLILVTVFYGTLVLVYMTPRTASLRQLHKVLSFFYTILTPLVNPLLCSLRNREVKGVLGNALRKTVACIESSYML
ncbi:olfactory receptor 13C7-like [Gavia stellata]|uniref:olfactory receptor 13C7-like n=1 Tax=Gavia stellata TaxID=37040 RepID=UPI002896A702|nr:olfactory receptor 13C7-like [Gavia stellata]